MLSCLLLLILFNKCIERLNKIKIKKDKYFYVNENNLYKWLFLSVLALFSSVLFFINNIKQNYFVDYV